MEISRARATASVPGTNFEVEADAPTLEEAQALALKRIDQKIDDTVGGIARGGLKGYERNKELKDSVVVEPPIKNDSAPVIS